MGVNTLVNQFVNLHYDLRTVFRIGYAKPLGSGVEHFAGSLAGLDKFIDERGDIELGFEFLTVLCQEALEGIERIAPQTSPQPAS